MKRMLPYFMVLLTALTAVTGCSATTSQIESGASGSSQAVSGQSSDTMSETGGGTFIVGLDDSFPPMGFRDESNEIVGFDIDLAKEVGNRLGLEVVLQPIDWASKEAELNSGNVDCLWNALTITPERQESMLLSRPYLKNHQVICVRPDSGISSKADLEGKTVALQTESSAELALEKDEIAQKIKEVVPFPENVSALNDMKAGRVDAVILDEVVANYYQSKDPENFKVLEDSLAEEEYAIAFQKEDTELAEKVQEVLDEMVEDGTTAEISNKWFGKDIFLK